MSETRRKQQRGGSALETALLLPWFIFLFVGAYDWGFYAHALVSTEAAARAAVLYTSSDSTLATDPHGEGCSIVLDELRIVSNVGSSTTTCTSSPVIASFTSVTGADNQPAAQVSVAYTTMQLIPIPGLLEAKATFYRVAQMRIWGGLS